MNAPALPALLFSRWELDWSVTVPVLAVATLYVTATRRASVSWPARRTAAFMAGLCSVAIALQSGIGRYDDQLLSAHMAQHMLLLLVAPLLLLGGQPVILTLSALAPRRRTAVAKALARLRGYTRPLPALVAFGAVVVLTHLPSLYDVALRHQALHFAEHALYLSAGLIMWSPLIDGDPAPRHRLSGFGRLAYLIAAMLPMALVGAYLNRHATLMYPPYRGPAHALGISALDDQAVAGAIMWVIGNTIMVAVGLWAAVAAMVAEERRQLARDARAAS